MHADGYRRSVDLHLSVVHHSDLNGAVGKLHLSVIRVVACDARLDVPAKPNGSVTVEL